ncbi:replication restart helicase PriA [Oceanivirga miroungae]|uniref:Replication restart protein PriA n=1 Tax=Oceanivirga miroungae TaxID=1130046 RepID=A0A6I8M9I6_9FUSO|nr:primosomal protein N' [Oceanivirga miroungae]VWL85476.1 primosomal protein N' [Oceanivirga miroungae]
MFYYNIQVGKRNMLFTYKSEIEIENGTFCSVSLANKVNEGIVVGKVNVDEKKLDYEIKEILEVKKDKLNKNLFSLINFIHSYYLEPYSSLIPLIDYSRENSEEKINEVISNKEYEKFKLNDEQQKVSDDIVNSSEMFHLINGVTGSGKTIVYMDIIRKALIEDKSVIFIIPEISLTPQFLKRLNDAFKDELAIWHSKLSEKKKEEYRKSLKIGEKKILLGTRSCIFQEVKNLAYIIIDEEQSSSYKQENRPRYHLKNVAIKRVMLENAKLILGSATPSYETTYHVKNGLIKQHNILNRYNNVAMPEYIIVDLNKYDSYLTDELIKNINEKIEKKEQVIILLNRKAYSIAIKCNDCKVIQECKKCTYNLTYYAKKNILKCKQCETTYKYKQSCSNCNSQNLIKLGYGTEKLEEELCEIFDENRILRMDSDTMNTNKKILKAYNEFLDYKYDILIGTSIIAKGFHFPNVTLVCILNADELSNIPSFKIQEKTFELITQAAGRSGRADKKGYVIIQSFNKDSDLIKAVISNDYEYMYNSQMETRRQLNFPPFTKAIKILITDKNEKRLLEFSNKLYIKVYGALNELASITALNDEYIYMVSNRYRKNIIMYFEKANENKVKRILKNIIDNLDVKSSMKVLVDVDPT